MAKNVYIKNIYYMLAYAFHGLQVRGFQDLETEEFDTIHELFTSVLLKGVSNQIKRGLHKDYVPETEATSSLRGKIQLAESLKRNTLMRKQLVCQYDTFFEDTALNQILKSTMTLLLRHASVKLDSKKALRKLLMYFESVTTLEPPAINWSAVRYHRNNVSYKMLINVCWLVIKGLLMSTSSGQNRLATFLDDQKMHRLYEKFVLEYYRQEFPMYSANASYIDWDLASDDDTSFLPRMKSDITLSHGSKTLIIDTKFYSHTMQSHAMYDTKTFISNNLYQIFTYVKNKDKAATGDVTGVLLYAMTDEDVTPNHCLTVGGNRIGIHSLNLGVEWSAVREQLDRLPVEYLVS